MRLIGEFSILLAHCLGWLALQPFGYLPVYEAGCAKIDVPN